MDLMPRGSPSPSSSGLNPNAPLFVPQAYRKAEESLAEQWRRLVESTAAPWLGDQHRRFFFFDRSSERRKEEEEEEGKAVGGEDYGSVLPDEDTLFHGYQPYEEEQRHARGGAPASWNWSWKDGHHGLFGPAERRPTGLNLLRVSPLLVRKPN